MSSVCPSASFSRCPFLDVLANTPAFNQPLSEERAQLTLALLEGGDSSRETFKKLAQGRHTIADIKQILSWAAGALPGFDCDPGIVDDNLGTATGPIRNFQNSYNAQRATIAPSSPSLTPDGSVGLLTWGAFFDCYEFALQQELGVDAAGLAALRGKLAFADPSHKSLGFSEYFPIEELGVDNFRSQSNRRVEILFFEQGEEPDIAHALDDPETSDLYLPGHYERTPIRVRLSGLASSLTFDLQMASDLPWTTDDTITIRDSSGDRVLRARIDVGESIGTARRFVIARDPNELYQAVVDHSFGSIVVFNQLSAGPDLLAL